MILVSFGLALAASLFTTPTSKTVSASYNGNVRGCRGNALFSEELAIVGMYELPIELYGMFSSRALYLDSIGVKEAF